MPFQTITDAEIAVDAPLKTGLFGKIKNDLDYLNGLSTTGVDAGGAPLVLNGSFESPAVATSTTPDNWTIVAGDSGAAVLVNTEQNHGAQSLKFTRSSTAGQSGGTATTDFMNVSPSLRYQVRFMIKSSGGDTSNTVVINWYTANQSALSSTTVYSSTAPPTDWRAYGILVTPPATAVFAKLVISGGTTTSTPASTRSIYFDAVSIIVKPAMTEMSAFTGNGSLTVPAGAFLCKARVWGSAIGNGPSLTRGGYAEKSFEVRPGDSVTVTMTVVGLGVTVAVAHVASSTSITCVTGVGTTSGNASGGTLNVTGGSVFPSGYATLEY